MYPLFHGSALCEIEPDGSVSIPDFVSAALDAEAEELLISRHDADFCLIGFARDHLDALHSRNEARRLADEERGADVRNHFARMRRAFALVEKMPREGLRARIPAALRHLGRIGSIALFVGAGDSFEIWNPDLAAENEDEQFRELATYRLNASGASNDSIGVH